ncbi:MAG: hypothetical protein KFB96_08830 [Thiocapsa sp.]|uniref:hypothetical protein n=1 Tax=Thiocapsa sp. TaxID=2024551 RepID=UPI001BCDE5D8|nr:hypothetical protein [Thiocapsa sp.]QVL50510.1 MAG: hypothetical protein KFB96_08830 [Thiocapsa sp.]
MHPNQPAAQRQRVLAHIADTDVGERIRARDHLIVLTKPKKRPDWMTRTNTREPRRT